MIDRWLAKVESDPSSTPLEQKIINNRPADVHDVCFNNSGATAANVDASQELPLDSPACTVGPVAIAMRSPRIVAGGPMAENVFKCRLKPLSFLDADDTVCFSMRASEPASPRSFRTECVIGPGLASDRLMRC